MNNESLRNAFQLAKRRTAKTHETQIAPEGISLISKDAASLPVDEELDNYLTGFQSK